MAKKAKTLEVKTALCKRGHLRTPENLYSRGTCKICVRITTKAYQQSHRQWVSERGRAWRSTMEGKRTRKNNDLLRVHGITLVDYENLLLLQGNACAVCGTADPKGRGSFHVDHNHSTGVVRGLLCHPCNTIVIPALEHYKVVFPSAEAYLHAKT